MKSAAYTDSEGARVGNAPDSGNAGDERPVQPTVPSDAPSAARTPYKQPPMAGDRWRSRDRRDNDLIVRVLSVDSAFVYILRRRKSRVRLTRWHSEYEFVGQF